MIVLSRLWRWCPETCPRRPDADHCMVGHDLRICGVYVDKRGNECCKACVRARRRRYINARRAKERVTVYKEGQE